MATLWQYLEQNAKFLSPAGGGDIINSSDVNDIEADSMDTRWKPTAARYDGQMVNSLLRTLHDYLGDSSLPVERARLDRLFQPLLDDDGMDDLWTERISREARARILVQIGALNALGAIMRYLGRRIRQAQEVKAPVDNVNSLVDFALFLENDEEKKILVEIKSPSVLQGAINKMQGGSFPLLLKSHRPPDEKVITKLCICMAAHKVHWAAVTSHDKWVFLRLHPDLNGDPPRPYISFSTAEAQANNTRPFRALLAMMLATALDLSVESHAYDKELPPREEGKEQELPLPGDTKERDDRPLLFPAADQIVTVNGCK